MNNNLNTQNKSSNLQINNSNTIFYQNKSLSFHDMNFIKNSTREILSLENIEKYFNQEDYKRLIPFLPTHNEGSKFSINDIKLQIKEIYNPENSKIGVSPLENFKNMLSNNYFSKHYQKNFEKLKNDSLEEYIKSYEKTYKYLRINQDKYEKINYKNENNYIEEEGSMNNLLYNQYNFDYESNSFLASSGYTTILSEEELEQEVNEYRENLSESNQNVVKERDDNLVGILSNERFQILKTNKNQLTIRARTKEEIKDFQKQETERYKNPHLPWLYNNFDGSTCIVAPVLKKFPTNSNSKPRDHVLLRPERPSYVTILCLARDAAGRLPDGVGTRADICDLLKDSQYVNEKLSDSQINNIVSGALDRLHYEKDPCVKYDLQRKLWIYLHKNRTKDDLAWQEQSKRNDLLKSDSKIDNTSEIDLKSDEKNDFKDNMSISVSTINLNMNNISIPIQSKIFYIIIM